MSDPLAGRNVEEGLLSLPSEKRPATHDQNMVTYLSLFLLLLVFFILLSTISQQRHDRAFATAGSLAAAFGGASLTPGRTALGPESARRPMAERIGGLIAEWSGRLRIEARQSGERIQFALPIAVVFARPDTAALSSDVEAFLADLAAQIREASADAPIAVDVVVGGTIIGGWTPGVTAPLPLRRAALMGQNLTGLGLGGATLTVGVEEAEAPRVRFVMRPDEGELTDVRP